MTSAEIKKKQFSRDKIKHINIHGQIFLVEQLFHKTSNNLKESFALLKHVETEILSSAKT